MSTIGSTASASGGMGDNPSGTDFRRSREVDGERAKGGLGGRSESSAADGMSGEAQPDFYAALGVPVSASPADIKVAYRKIAMRVHPDVEGKGSDRDTFELITAAYEVLSDPGKRSTYDQGLAMRSFVDQVRAGKWSSVVSAVANLGVAATSVGVSVGKAAAQPLAKDLARSIEELTGSGESADPIVRQQQAASRARIEAERKVKMYKRRAEEYSEEASKLEAAKKARLEEKQEWNVVLGERKHELSLAEEDLEASKALAAEATEATKHRRSAEQLAADVARLSRASREKFLQVSASTQRRVSTAEAAVAGAEQRLAEALKALDDARLVLASCSDDLDVLNRRRDQVLAEADSAEEAFEKAKEATMDSRTELSQRQTTLSGLQTAYWEKSRREGLAKAKIKELDGVVDSISARALRNRLAAEESRVAAQRAEEAVAVAKREESRLLAEAAAARAAREAEQAAREEEEARRERERAALAVEEAVARAQTAEHAMGLAADRSSKAAELARAAEERALRGGDRGEGGGGETETGGSGSFLSKSMVSTVEAAMKVAKAEEMADAGKPHASSGRQGGGGGRGGGGGGESSTANEEGVGECEESPSAGQKIGVEQSKSAVEEVDNRASSGGEVRA